MTLQQQLAEQLRLLCEKNNLTTYQLAEMTGIGQSRIVDLLNGKVNASFKTVERLAKALKRTPKLIL